MDDFKVKEILAEEARKRIRAKIAKLEKTIIENEPPSNKCVITIKKPGQSLAVFEYDDIRWVCEKSVNIYRSPDGTDIEVENNGQERMTIHLWTGSKSYEDFIDKVYIYQKQSR